MDDQPARATFSRANRNRLLGSPAQRSVRAGPQKANLSVCGAKAEVAIIVGDVALPDGAVQDGFEHEPHLGGAGTDGEGLGQPGVGAGFFSSVRTDCPSGLRVSSNSINISAAESLGFWPKPLP